MFDGGGSQGAGGFDMSDLLAQAQAMQNQLMEAQANLESQEIEGSAGGGLVTALVSGTGELLSLTIHPQAVDPDDTETLADLIVAAVRDASENAKEVAARAMGPLVAVLVAACPASAARRMTTRPKAAVRGSGSRTPVARPVCPVRTRADVYEGAVQDLIDELGLPRRRSEVRTAHRVPPALRRRDRRTASRARARAGEGAGQVL